MGGKHEGSTDGLSASVLVNYPITFYAKKPMGDLHVVPINSIRCQNVTIHRKNKKKDFNERIVDEGEKELLLEEGYIPMSKRIHLAKEHFNTVEAYDRALRAQKPFMEVPK